MHSSLQRAIDMFSILLPQRTHLMTKSTTQQSNYPPQTAQILKCWPPRTKNSFESTTSPLISHLSDSLQRTMGTNSKLTIISHILPRPPSCSRQFTQNTSRSILAWYFSTTGCTRKKNNVRGEEINLDTSIHGSAKVDNTK